MNTNLYAIRGDVHGVNVLVAAGHIAVTALGVNFELVFIHQLRTGCGQLFDMLADRDREIAHIYTSPFDGKTYTEWTNNVRPLMGVVITDEGVVMRVDDLPPEEFQSE